MKTAVLASLLLLQADEPQIASAILDGAVRSIAGYNGRNELKPIGDEAFLKRIFKDLVDGTPSAEEIKAFVADADPRKRAAKIDQLVADARFDDFWARRFTQVFFSDPEKFRIEITVPPWGMDVRAVKAFERWMRGQFQKDAAWTDIVSQMLVARGSLETVPEMAYVLSFNGVKGLAAEFPKGVSRHFLGIRLSCAECHDHPFDKWRVEDYYGLSSFVIRQKVTMVNDVPQIKYGDAGEAMMPALDGRKDADVKMARGGAASPNFLFGGQAGRDEDRMTALAAFMSNKANTQVPRALANRVWGWLFGYGVVHPVDDFNLKNKAASPALMQALTTDTIDHKYSLKRLVRVICNTNAYQMPTPEEAPDAMSFRHQVGGRIARGRYYPVTSKAPEIPLRFEAPASWTRMNSSGPKALYVVPGKTDPLRRVELTLHTGKRDKDFVEVHCGNFVKPKKNTQVLQGKGSVTLSEISGMNTCIQGSDGPVDYTILAAVVEPPEGAYTFKFEGPTALVNEWREEFLTLLKGAGK